MEEVSSNYRRKTLAKGHPFNRRSNGSRKSELSGIGDGEFDGADQECDFEVLETLSSGFERVQSVLDQNRVLIQQVNENHQSKSPDNLVKNVALIREINGNISKVVSIYSDLSINFTNLVRQRKVLSKSSGDGGNEMMDAAMGSR